MNTPLLLVVTAIYAWVSYNYLREGNPGMALSFAAYGVGYIGFIIAGWK